MLRDDVLLLLSDVNLRLLVLLPRELPMSPCFKAKVAEPLG